MSIQALTNQRMIEKFPLKNSLKTGQIMQGKILKLYPRQHALVQFGRETLIAQLKAPLDRGERYHFRVENTSGTIVLKVVGNSLSARSDQNAATLLQTLGLAQSKPKITFVTSLINDHIPFGKADLLKAFQLIDTAETPGHTALKQLMMARLPLNQSFLKAVQKAQSSSFSTEGRMLQTYLLQNNEQTPTQQALAEKLTWFLDANTASPQEVLRHILRETTEDKQHTFSLLHRQGIIHKGLTWQAWQNEWKQFMNTHQILSPLQDTIPEHVPRPFSFNENEAARQLKAMQTMDVHSLLDKWQPALQAAVRNEASMSQVQFLQMQKELLQPGVLSQSEQQSVKKVLGNSTIGLKNVYRVLTNLSKTQALPIETRFLAHLENSLKTMGLSHEFVAARSPASAETTVKSLLIQLVGYQNQTSNEQVQPLLNLINGLQIDSIQETPHVIQVSFELPGAKLGLRDDAGLDFIGRKKPDGTIDPDDCTIVFHLNLTSIKETIIDMHVQKRTVSLTIWSESDIDDQMARSLKPALTEGLKQLDYYLSSIHFEQIQETAKGVLPMRNRYTNFSRQSSGGVDMRI